MRVHRLPNTRRPNPWSSTGLGDQSDETGARASDQWPGGRGSPEPARLRAGVALINPQSVHLISGRNLNPAGRRGCYCVPAPGRLGGGGDTGEAYG